MLPRGSLRFSFIGHGGGRSKGECENQKGSHGNDAHAWRESSIREEEEEEDAQEKLEIMERHQNCNGWHDFSVPSFLLP